MKLRDLPYKTEFYWRGERYRQWTKYWRNKILISFICYKPNNIEFSPCRILASTEVKPVLKPSDVRRLTNGEQNIMAEALDKSTNLIAKGRLKPSDIKRLK